MGNGIKCAKLKIYRRIMDTIEKFGRGIGFWMEFASKGLNTLPIRRQQTAKNLEL